VATILNVYLLLSINLKGDDIKFQLWIFNRLLTIRSYKLFKVDLALYEKRAAKGKRVTRELEAVFD